MNTPRMARAVGCLDDDLVAGAVESRPKKNAWIRWGSVAACLALLVIAGAALLPSLLGSRGGNPGGMKERYQNVTVVTEATAIVWPWEMRTVYEQYGSLRMDGTTYTGRGREVPAALVGGRLGAGEATGFEEIEGEVHRATFDVYEITGVSPDAMVAVRMEGRCYAFLAVEDDPPATWGEVMATYALPETVELGRFSREKPGAWDGDFLLRDDEPVWRMLEECSDAAAVDPMEWEFTQRSMLSFTVTSEALGVYRRALSVTEDGYVWTNAFDRALLYFIGEDAADRIIRYAGEHSEPTETEPFQNTVAGRVVEIGEQFIGVDDSILCANAADGVTYRIPLDDIRISRYVDLGVIRLGDTVQVAFEGEIDDENIIKAGNSVSISQAVIAERDVYILE